MQIDPGHSNDAFGVGWPCVEERNQGECAGLLGKLGLSMMHKRHPTASAVLVRAHLILEGSFPVPS